MFQIPVSTFPSVDTDSQTYRHSPVSEQGRLGEGLEEPEGVTERQDLYGQNEGLGSGFTDVRESGPQESV